VASRPRAVAARARTALVAAVVVAAAVWGAAAGLVIDRLSVSPIAGIAVGLAVAAVVLWRGRQTRSTQRVAIWIEEHAPALQYALVTAVDPRYASTDDDARTAAVTAVNVSAMVGRAALRTVGVALLALGAAALLPAGRLDGRFRSATGEASSRLTSLIAHVTPPTYARLPAHELSDPATIAALVGSRIALDGQRGWDTAFTMPMAPQAMRLVDRQFERLIVLEPRADAPPTVVLTAPVRDTTIREPATGAVVLVAEGADDIGLAEGYFEYLITSGDEEAGGVKGREARTGRVAFADAKTGTMRATLRLDTLELTGGDVLSVRAVVQDGNTVSGPGRGTSETRTIRVATKQEYDSLALEAAPPQGVDTADKVATGDRLYLRGAPPVIVVNVDRVRMKGTEKPDAGPRTAGLPSDTLRALVEARFAAAIALVRAPRGTAPWTAGVDSLTMLRVLALSRDVPLASALDDAVVALRAGTDATPALARARHLIIGTPVASNGLSVWGGP
jgi:hypothetical protein